MLLILFACRQPEPRDPAAWHVVSCAGEGTTGGVEHTFSYDSVYTCSP